MPETITLSLRDAIHVLGDLAFARDELYRARYVRHPGIWANELAELDRSLALIESLTGFVASTTSTPRHRALVSVEARHA
jgi:hypothetical protein